MSTVMIQVRNVPQRVHRTLKARAVLAGKSLSDCILEELTTMAALPSQEEVCSMLGAAEPFAMKRSSAARVRSARDAA